MDVWSHDGSAVRSVRGSERARFGANEVSENRGKANGEERPVSQEASENRVNANGERT
ncbi:hypothetical protein AB7C87_17470 [Natrarchaeobius sp. A-rgal3]|uniref:hypothetical protein n=1 Tax=Natrarchaeobius versutus TaxID=1679078 RepID=UPI00350ECCE8